MYWKVPDTVEPDTYMGAGGVAIVLVCILSLLFGITVNTLTRAVASDPAGILLDRHRDSTRPDIRAIRELRPSSA